MDLDRKHWMNWKYLAVIGMIVAVLAFRPGSDSSTTYTALFLVLGSVVLFCLVAFWGFKEPWNVLLLGDETICNRFKIFATPGLAKKYIDKRIVFHRAKEGSIPDIPFDVVLLGLDLNSVRNFDNALHERKAVEHFGKSIYRHMIILLGYDLGFSVPENIPDYLKKGATEQLKLLLNNCERRFVDICLDSQDNRDDIEYVKKLTDTIDNVLSDNCGPIKHRIILLGGRNSYKSNIGNLIFNEDVFGNANPNECVGAERVVDGKRMLVINTPEAHSESIENRDSDNQKKISESLLLTSPGPRVFVMVIKDTQLPDDISSCFEVFENRFGIEAYRHLIVVLKKDPKQQNIPEPLRSRLNQMGDRYIGRLIYDHGDCLLKKGNSIQKQIMDSIKKPDVETTKRELSLVLVGPATLGKSHTANSMLDLGKLDHIFPVENPERKKSRVSVAMRSTDDYDVVIADTPSLGTHVMSNEEVYREIKKCAFYPDMKPRPIGVVLRCDRSLFPQELACLQFLERKLPESFSRTSIVIFTRKNYMELQENISFREYLKQTGNNEGPLRKLLSTCHWRCMAYENTEEDRSQQNEVVYSLANQVMNPDLTLQLILVGHTGSGKSATGNTIMSTKAGVPAFNATFSQTSNTEKCQVEEFEVAGRKVKSVDTPGLFDTRAHQYDNTTTMEEIAKSMLYTLPGPDVFLLVINAADRLTMETQKTMRLLKQHFGDEMLGHLVIVFTRLDELKRKEKTVEKVFDEIQKGGSDVGRQFFDSSREYVAFDNRPGHQTGNEAKELLETVERVIAANEHRRFTNKKYEDIIKQLDWYGTGRIFDLKYTFDQHPAQCTFALRVVTTALVGSVLGSE